MVLGVMDYKLLSMPDEYFMSSRLKKCQTMDAEENNWSKWDLLADWP